ncbi:MAG: LPS export ABC transporter ATP-binding protein [Proteobacteria bacterium]|nr:LPS export ABC transporter ATP-binding protein [Pseudomonadota bacterium]MBU1450975.1 LPS export ABC transporter ATP-binding protein [Pseudomonadota bacterium]MBU2470432.1 LPS export ABC transporter ATP-binding protein [Pseudomonadota bacterium]MBU2517428.1 LPS export ABC transporter ATP-binding protein [Pseudomonadota bacterium]
MPRLRLENLVKIYGGRRVVDGVSLELRDREIVGLLGPNGAGKTTSFYMTVGLIRPNEGRVLLDQKDITELPMYQRARLGISYLPQEPSIFRKLTVEDNVRGILETLAISEAEEEARLERLLGDLGVAHLRHNRAFSLSGGERRRVEITRLLVTEPSFILLDEPFAGIDPLAVADLQNIIRQLKDRGIGILISDHNVRETLGVCDRAYIVNAGTLLEEGTPEAIANSEVARRIYLGEQFKL